ncbi:hypothetical protein [Streptomyces sp. SM12]|uniref:hypothetical protein n=1 Tax=Streptomyces sp. SM12 TaxID=1071602 RepID=UPI0015E178AC|nr:hypothetical protein [Streptomyces sp. SM12]
MTTVAPLMPITSAPTKKELPTGQPRAWYESHNRRLKALQLATALLNAGVYHPTQATDQQIRATAPTIGVRPPSETTCRLVRVLMLH